MTGDHEAQGGNGVDQCTVSKIQPYYKWNKNPEKNCQILLTIVLSVKITLVDNDKMGILERFETLVPQFLRN